MDKNIYGLSVTVYKASNLYGKKGKVCVYAKEEQFTTKDDDTAKTLGRWWYNEILDHYETDIDIKKIVVLVENKTTHKKFHFGKNFEDRDSY